MVWRGSLEGLFVRGGVLMRGVGCWGMGERRGDGGGGGDG